RSDRAAAGRAHPPAQPRRCRKGESAARNTQLSTVRALVPSGVEQLKSVKELDLADPSCSHQVDDSLVAGARPGAAGISQRRDVGSVDEDLDVVENHADGWLILRHQPKSFMRVARVGEDAGTLVCAE